MRCLLVLPVLLVLTSAPRTAAADAGTNHMEWIVPGRSIGDARLGMSELEIRAVNARSSCQVSARYRDGRAVVLATEWGGMCQTRGGVQVALSFSAAIREFGHPEKVVHEATYPEADAVWVPYPARGIAFRVLVVPKDRAMLIQAISVFAPNAVAWRP